ARWEGLCGPGVERGLEERVGMANGPGDVILARGHRSVVDAMRTLPDRDAKLAEARLQGFAVERREGSDRRDAPPGEQLARPHAHAPEPFDGERREEGRLPARRDDNEPVRLAQVRPDLGAELVRRD